MAKPQKTEEQLKADIFNVYSKCREEQASDRRQVYFGQLCDFVFRWCRCATSPRFYEANEMGVEIVEVLERIVKENKMPEKENDFFKYLVTALYNARNAYHRNNKPDKIKLPRIVYDMEKMIWTQESNVGRTLSEDEKIQFISKWFGKSEKKAKIYLKAIHTKNVNDLTPYDDKKEIDISDSNYEPESIFFSKVNAADIREAVETVLQSKQERTRECFRALFTVYCIDKIKDFEEIAAVLDVEILEKYRKDGDKPNQYEIYQKYHTNVQKNSADALASKNLDEFIKFLKIHLKEKI